MWNYQFVPGPLRAHSCWPAKCFVNFRMRNSQHSERKQHMRKLTTECTASSGGSEHVCDSDGEVTLTQPIKSLAFQSNELA